MSSKKKLRSKIKDPNEEELQEVDPTQTENPKGEPLVEKEGKEESKKPLSRIFRFAAFVIFVADSIIMSGDNGVLSSSKKLIQADLGMNDKEYGLFGSVPSIGRTVSSFIFIWLLQMDNRKLLTLCCFGINGGLFFVYMFTNNKYILLLDRFLIGTVRVYPHIYIRAWIHQFGINTKGLKSIMLSFMTFTSPLGQVFGFTIGAFIKEGEWRKGYVYVGTLILAVSSLLIFIPSDYFKGSLQFFGYYNEDGNLIDMTAKAKLNDEKEEQKRIAGIKGDSIFASGEIKSNDKKKGKGELNLESLLKILTSPGFVFGVLTRACLLLIFQVIHLFVTDHAKTTLKVTDLKEFSGYYGTASTLGPIAGGLIGGSVGAYLGGYESKKSVFILPVFGTLTLLVSFSLAYTTNLLIFTASLCSFFFFASCMLPTVEGFVMASIPKEISGPGASVSQALVTVLGNLPGPIIFGAISDYFKESNPSLPWRLLIHYYIIGFAATLLCALFRYRDLNRKDEKKEEETK